MKKIMLTVAGMCLVSLMAVNAQVTQQDTQITQDTTGISDQSGQPGVYGENQSDYTRDMEVIQPTDVPSNLRTTLGGSEYSGWEEGKVYHNTTTNEYLIVIGDEDAKVFRFDSEGQKIEDLDAGSDQGDTQNQNQNQDSQMAPGSGSTDSGDAGMSSGSTGTEPANSGATDTGSTGTGTTGTTGTSGTGTTGTGSTTDDQSSGNTNTR